MYKMNTPRRHIAKSRLRWYFQQVFVANQLPWRGDNNSEIDELVDLIIDAAKEEVLSEVRNSINGSHGFGWLRTED